MGCCATRAKKRDVGDVTTLAYANVVSTIRDQSGRGDA
jgi:hypothetical protein